MSKHINIRNTTTCLVVENAGGPGSKVITWNCSTIPSNQDNALWMYDSTSGRLITRYNGRNICMGVSEGDMMEGGDVVVWDCNSSLDQRWELRDNGTIRNVNSLLCLNVENGRVTQRDCRNSTRFVW